MEPTTAAKTAATTETVSRGVGFGYTSICDVCAKPVSKEDCFTTELTAQGATCPTMMTFHLACYEAAASLWVPEGPDSTCRVDPLFPETAQWNRMQGIAEDLDG